jgi:hypothetical protein
MDNSFTGSGTFAHLWNPRAHGGLANLGLFPTFEDVHKASAAFLATQQPSMASQVISPSHESEQEL